MCVQQADCPGLLVRLHRPLLWPTGEKDAKQCLNTHSHHHSNKPAEQPGMMGGNMYRSTISQQGQDTHAPECVDSQPLQQLVRRQVGHSAHVGVEQPQMPVSDLML
jgi:hypothetical protein